MNIFMITSEAVPFSKSGGLADVASALSIALAELGHNVSVLMPAYGFINLDDFSSPIANFKIELNSKKENIEVVKTTLKNVDFYAVKHPYFTERNGIYGDTSFTPYADNFERYILLSKAIFPLCKKIDLKIDILHAHDWTAGFAPYLLKQNKDKYFNKCKSVFTIHNLAYQGTFPRLDAIKASIEIEDDIFNGDSINKTVNMLKVGLLYSDFITTVSPTYAKEIQEKELGCNLDHILKKRESSLFGIINGIDYDEWNPSTDEFFTTHYDINNLEGKKQLKREVQKIFNLEVNDNIPLISMISRIAEQKGFYELLDGENALETILKNNDSQVLIIGTGDEEIIRRLKILDDKYDNLSLNIMFSNKYAHMVEGASDFFL
ncbi:MAG: glycogen/starch synthase, partial [Sphaerochaetaceae bacterium]|nr:glycogen/starch synthase [Sphaerochaetaceae bacterium]